MYPQNNLQNLNSGHIFGNEGMGTILVKRGTNYQLMKVRKSARLHKNQ